MKFSMMEKTLIFLLGGLLVAAFVFIKIGKVRSATGLIISAVGCGLMLYAAFKIRNQKRN